MCSSAICQEGFNIFAWYKTSFEKSSLKINDLSGSHRINVTAMILGAHLSRKSLGSTNLNTVKFQRRAMMDIYFG
jgi:hypothetical protein